MELTAEKARELFDYDPETGVVTLKKDHGLNKAGQRAGRPIGNTRRISFRGIEYAEHKFIVFLVKGVMPASDLLVRHKNGVNSDNRWENLMVCKPVSRDKVSAASLKKRKPSKNHDKTCVKGIHFLMDSRKYILVMEIYGEKKVIGEFDDFRKAFIRKIEIEKEGM
jgi:hypothetical protein